MECSISPISSEEQFQVSFSLTKIDIPRRASLVTSTIVKDVVKSVVEPSDSVSSFGELDMMDLKFDLQDDNLLIVCASSASDLALYDQLKRDSDCVTHSELSESHNLFYFFNTSEAQLWVDGARFYGLTCSQNVSGFLQLAEACYIDECYEFISIISDTYSKSFVECSPLLVLWLVLSQHGNCSVFQMFGKKYVFLGGEILSLFISWVLEQRKEFDTHGITTLENIYTEYLVNRVDGKADEPLPIPQSHSITCSVKSEQIPNQMLEVGSEIEIVTNNSSECGEFYLELAEWHSVCITDSNGRMSLVSHWTNIFAEKFHDINHICVLKFNYYRLKRLDSRKVNSPFLRARAECKFDNCRDYIFYIEDEISMFNNRIVVKFYSEGSLSLQHTDGTSAYSRHLSCSERSKMGGLLVNNSVSKIFNKQFNDSDKTGGFCYGNLSYLKSAECLRKVKSEMKSENRFSNSYMEDVAATQQYFRYLLPDSPIPGYVQYFVQDPFIIHMYTSKQIQLLKFIKNKAVVLNLDATGSLISKPPSCSNKIYYYALTMQHPEYSTSPIPVAEMISSDHGTAEISHFLNKWCLSAKLVINRDLQINKVEMDYSWAMIHSTCSAFNKFTILNYLQNCWRFVNNGEDLNVTTVLHLCSAHVMHRISYNLDKKFKIDKQIKRIILHVFGRILNSNNIHEIDHLFELLCYVLCSKNNLLLFKIK